MLSVLCIYKIPFNVFYDKNITVNLFFKNNNNNINIRLGWSVVFVRLEQSLYYDTATTACHRSSKRPPGIEECVHLICMRDGAWMPKHAFLVTVIQSRWPLLEGTDTAALCLKARGR